jgi:hypothetical protein
LSCVKIKELELAMKNGAWANIPPKSNRNGRRTYD